jgi:hypothetical protein
MGVGNAGVEQVDAWIDAECAMNPTPDASVSIGGLHDVSFL